MSPDNKIRIILLIDQIPNLFFEATNRHILQTFILFQFRVVLQSKASVSVVSFSLWTYLKLNLNLFLL